MLRDEQREWIVARNPHFQAELCSGLFAPDQPLDGLERRPDGTEYPGIYLQNGVIWYPVRDRRPRRSQRRGGGEMKSEAPRGSRPLLFDSTEPDTIVLVEGEGQLLAMLSLGFRGVAAVGGANALLGRGESAVRNRERLRGKSVVVFFDPDAPGRDAADRTAAVLLDGVAARVARVFPPEEAGDVEDWVAAADTPDAARYRIEELLGGLDWQTRPDEVDEPEEPAPLVAASFPDADGGGTLAVSVFDYDLERMQLAVFGVNEREPDPVDAQTYPEQSVNHDLPPAPDPTEVRERTWSILDAWERDGVRYVPSVAEFDLAAIRDEMLIPPVPPSREPDTSEKLWRDNKSFYQRWLACGADDYVGMTSFCFMGYRLADAGFKQIPMLNFQGPPGSGKNRALDLMRHTCWRSYYTKPHAANLHRVIEYLGDFTMVIDEFHLERGRTTQGMQDLVDLLNQSFHRGSNVVRCAGENLEPRMFRVFGPKVFASYTADLDEGFARRTLVVKLGQHPPTEEMQSAELPEEAVEEARQLRARLLAFRARKLPLGRPDPQGERFRMVQDCGGSEVVQAFWPLLEMVPKGCPEDVEALLRLAKRRKRAAKAVEFTSDTAYLLDVLAQMHAEGQTHTLEDGAAFLPTADLARRVADDDRTNLGAGAVARLLKSAGVSHGQKRYGGGQQRKGFVLDAQLDRIMARHGVQWPRQPEPEDTGV